MGQLYHKVRSVVPAVDIMRDAGHLPPLLDSVLFWCGLVRSAIAVLREG